MSVRLMSLAFQATMPDTKVGDNNVAQATMKSVLLALADHASDEGKSIYPAVARLERMTGLKDRTIQRAESALESLGILKHIGYSEYGTKEYNIIPACLASFVGGDSGTEKVYQNHRGGDSEYKKSASESPKPSFKPSVKPIKHTHEKPDWNSVTPKNCGDIPEIRFFMDATGFIPGQLSYEFIYDFLRNNTVTAENLSAAWKAWNARGYNSRNVSGLLEWARDGIPERTKPAQRTPAKAGQDKFDQTAAMLQSWLSQGVSNGD